MLTSVIRRTALLAAAGALIAGASDARTLIMATDRAGTLFNATGAGIAKVASKHSKHRVIVRAFGGPDAYIHQLNAGEYDLTATSSNTSWFNYHGKTKSKKSTKNLRIIRSGAGALKLSFVVYADSSIKKISDLRGKRVTSDFGGHAAINPIVSATLAISGLSWADLKPVPVTGALDSPRVSTRRGPRSVCRWCAKFTPKRKSAISRSTTRRICCRNCAVASFPACGW